MRNAFRAVANKRLLYACWQVARTYWRRPRFWLFGVPYLLVALRWAPKTSGVDISVAVLTSALMAAILGCFVALHLRRQFGSPSAKVMPGFATAHLAVGMAASLLLWGGVPAAQAALLGVPWWGPVGAHAIAGIYLSLVICWRQAIVLMASLPTLIIVANSSIQIGRGDSRAQRFVTGLYPVDSAILIIAALAALPLAALFLRRMSDRQVAISDDFSVEAAPAEGMTGRWDEWLLRFRDKALRHRLADAGFGWWAVQRWRIPAITSWAQLFIALLLGVAIVGIANTFDSYRSSAATGVGVIVAIAMLIAPVASWHMRRGSIPQEFMRPVARGQYFRELALAFALDVALWATLASVFVCGIAWYVMPPESQSRLVILTPLIVLWPIALFVYGVGLATFRLRYWLPVMVGILIGWTIAAAYCHAFLLTRIQLQYRDYTVLMIPAAWALAGLLLALLTLRRWIRADVT